MNRLLEKQGNLQDGSRPLGLWELDRKIDIAMDALRLPPGDADVATLSGGERRRVALCRCCWSSPTCCCSTSPPTTSTPRASGGSSGTWRSFPGTVVAVTHDRYFLDNVAGWILELDRGAGIPWEGNYSSWLEQKQQRLARRRSRPRARQKTLQRELEWVRMSPRARQAKSKARITALRGAARGGRAADRGHRPRS